MATPTLTGSVSDPEFRRRRARHAAKTRSSVDHHISKVVDAWPSLTEAQRARLAQLFRPTRTREVAEK